jgi:hypothetical protein
MTRRADNTYCASIKFLNVADNDHPVLADTAVRCDSEIDANAGLTKLAVTIINDTVEKCEVSNMKAFIELHLASMSFELRCFSAAWIDEG